MRTDCRGEMLVTNQSLATLTPRRTIAFVVLPSKKITTSYTMTTYYNRLEGKEKSPGFATDWYTCYAL